MDLQRDSVGNIWEVDPTGATPPRFVSAPTTAPGPRVLVGADPVKARREERAEESAARSATASERAAEAANRQAGAAERTAGNQQYNNAFQLRSAYDALPPVKEYRIAIAQLATGLKTASDATGDNALIYAYAKTMDPASVVRESEMGMAASGQSAVDSAAANLKKQFGIAGGGQLSPQVRERLRREMLNKTTELNRVYSAQRQRFIEDAKAFGFDPKRIVGNHDGDAFRPIVKDYVERQKKAEPEQAPVNPRYNDVVAAYKKAGIEYDVGDDGEPIPVLKGGSVGKPPAQPGYEESVVGQGVSGMNEGLANVLGLPVDLSEGAMNLGIRGINAAANTTIPKLKNSYLGSDWLKAQMAGPFIYGQTNDVSGQVARRVGQSVGSAAVPAGMAGTAARAGVQLLAGLGGGLGAATAQQVFPGNQLAEMGGELIGGGLTGISALNVAKRNATRQIEAAVPTIPQLKEKAGNLYRSAEARGVVADPSKTQELADNLRDALTQEGTVSPTGRISDVYPKAKEAMQLADDYAGQAMTPTQMQTVRKIVADGLSSPEATDRRLGGILTDTFDQWANPLAPELSQARDVASRYLTAEQLTKARELAASKAGQFSGSGFENALRTEYRGLDRAAIKGNKRFSGDVTDAIENVSRGTSASNFARGAGRLYPSGVVSGALGSGLPALAAGVMSGSPVVGGAVGAGMATIGGLGRLAATQMGTRAADVAELVARNGGALPTAPLVTPETLRAMQALVAAQSAQYLPQQPVSDQPAINQEGYGAPDPFAGRKGKRYFPAAPLRR